MTKEEFNKEFIEACLTNSLDKVKNLIKLDRKLLDEEKILNLCLKEGHLDIVKFLISKNLTINEVKIEPLYAIKHLNCLKYLIEQGYNVLSRPDPVQLINYSLLMCNFTVTEYLIDLGFDIHLGNDSILRDGARWNNLYISQYAINKGGDIYALDHGALKESIHYFCKETAPFLYNLYSDKELANKILNESQNKNSVKWLKNKLLNDKLEQELIINKNTISKVKL